MRKRRVTSFNQLRKGESMDSRRDGIIAELRNNEEEVINFYKDLNAMQLGMIVYPEDPAWTDRAANPGAFYHHRTLYAVAV